MHNPHLAIRIPVWVLQLAFYMSIVQCTLNILRKTRSAIYLLPKGQHSCLLHMGVPLEIKHYTCYV